ncbi:hypothetical protein QBC35DRAFT_483964 [Podospora australis]|uniref:Uncharacterized protein n=1 Tax=Podospora australis TaxID=1536484 RepID=A0AAN7AND2_9PEZI|nr:hypothetical protein QBC35DRAFT_483964 [Podospora australis]
MVRQDRLGQHFSTLHTNITSKSSAFCLIHHQPIHLLLVLVLAVFVMRMKLGAAATCEAIRYSCRYVSPSADVFARIILSSASHYCFSFDLFLLLLLLHLQLIFSTRA